MYKRLTEFVNPVSLAPKTFEVPMDDRDDTLAAKYREIAEENSAFLDSADWEAVLKKIKERSLKGERKMIQTELRPGTRIRLEKEGFKVRWECSVLAAFYIITW